MNSKKLHLRIPASSVFTEKLKKGSGGKTFTRTDYRSHGEKLLSKFKAVKSEIASSPDSQLTSQMFLQVEVPKKEKIKEYSGKLKNLGMNIVSYSTTNPTTARVNISSSDFSSLQGKIETYTYSEKHVGRSNIAVIEELVTVPVEEKLIASKDDDLEVVSMDFIISLYTSLSVADKDKIITRLYQVLAEKGAKELVTTKLPSGQVVIIGQAEIETLKDVGRNFYSVKEITPNGKLISARTFVGNPLPTGLSVSVPTTDIVVGVIDSGMNTSAPVFSTIDRHSEELLPSTVTPNYGHGSMVASRIVFGDEIESIANSGNLSPLCYVMSIAMLGENRHGKIVGHDEVTFTLLLASVVQRRKDEVKIYNLSIGLRSIKNNHYSVLAKELDFLSKEYGILFIISSGNIDEVKIFPDCFLRSDSRVQSPGESLLSLTVGSIANHGGAKMWSRQKEISPFSCVGPGADLGIKPEVMSHGGNLQDNETVNPRTAAYGIDATGTNLAYNVGTSFSAPIITNNAVQIYNHYSDASPNLTKALLIHFAQEVLHPTLTGRTHFDLCGFGEPNIEHALYALDHSVSYLYQGTVLKDTSQKIKFQVPSCFVTNKDTFLKVKITVVYDPPVDPDNALEYSRSKFTLKLFKNTIDGSKEISMKSRYNKHYSPILQFEQEFQRNFASGDWFVQLSATSKDGVSTKHTSQNYAIIIEVIDVNNRGTIYDDVVREFGSTYGITILRKVA